MHSRDMVELAALVATHGRVLVEGPARISASALEQYWAASKCRLDRWLRALKKFAAASSGEALDRPELVAQIRPVIEEIFVAEMALRTWTAVLYAYDRRRGTRDAEPVAHSVLLGHLEVRQRALAILVHSPLIVAEEAVLLNRLRRRAERWTDFLLGYVCEPEKAGELAFDADRAAEFSADLQSHHGPASNHGWTLALTSLRMAFQTGLSKQTPNCEANEEIAAGIMACFPAELFDDSGTLRSLWLVRLAHATNDAQGMIDELLHLDDDIATGLPLHRLTSATTSGAPRRRF